MKLSIKDAERICNKYDIGKLISYKENKEGYVNHGFIFKTEKGKFMVQILGDKLSPWKRLRIKQQFKLLEYLNKNKFPYEIPSPITNKEGKYLLKFNDSFLWVYRYIKGEVRRGYNKNDFKELIKMTSIFQDYTKNFNFYFKKDNLNLEFLRKEYSRLKIKKTKNELDKLMVENCDLMLNLINKFNVTDSSRYVINHSDLNEGNVLFNGDKIVGVIDFDNVQYAPKTRDLGIILLRNHYLGRGYNSKKFKLLKNEYKKYNSLTKKEEKLILYYLLKEEVGVFLWFYNGMKKHRENALKLMNQTLEEIKKVSKVLGLKDCLKSGEAE